MFQHAIVVELAEIFYLGDASLVKYEVVLLQAKINGLDQGVDDSDGKFVMVSVQGTEENRQEVDVAVLYLARLGKDLV